MLLVIKSRDVDRICLKDRNVASPAQIARAVVLGVFFALLLVWILPIGSAKAEPKQTSAGAELSSVAAIWR
jgi:hypothetical protein